MSSGSDDEMPPELRHSTEEVLRAKARNPGMFISAWQADEEDINYWSENQLKSDPKKRFIVAGQKGDIAGMQSVLDDVFGPFPYNEETKVKLKEFLFTADEDGYTALHRAVYSGHHDAVTYLLKLGASTEARTVDGWRPLHSAVFWNQLSCAQLLLETGADLTAVSGSGQNVLHLTVANNRTPETLVYLMSEVFACRKTMVADLWTSRNSAGDTPADMLRRQTAFATPLFLHAFSKEATRLK